MSKSWTNPKLPSRPAISLVALLLIGLSLSLNVLAADTIPSAQPPVHISSGMRVVLSTGRTVTQEPIQYPSGAPAQITAVEITLQPGQETGWHTHPVPLFAYILEGELTVDYGVWGQRIFLKGEALAEAINEVHNGRNRSLQPVKILAVFIGMEGTRGTSPASPPAR